MYFSAWIIIIHKFFFVVLASPSKLPEQSDFRARRIIIQTALFSPHRASLRSAFKLHAEDTTWAGCRSVALRVVAISHVFVEEEERVLMIGSSAESSAWGFKWNQWSLLTIRGSEKGNWLMRRGGASQLLIDCCVLRCYWGLMWLRPPPFHFPQFNLPKRPALWVRLWILTEPSSENHRFIITCSL